LIGTDEREKIRIIFKALAVAGIAILEKCIDH